MTGKRKPREEPKRRFKTEGINQVLQAALGPAIRRRGFADERILQEWEQIAGPLIAARCKPVKIHYGRQRTGTLHIQASSAIALELQHLAPQLIERVNGYFGYRAVHRLQIIQMPVPGHHHAAPAPPVPEVMADADAAEKLTAKVDDTHLRTALTRLHMTLQRKTKTRQKRTDADP